MSPPDLRGAAGAAHVLCLCDPSRESLNTAWRAVLVARDLQVPMRLLYRCEAGTANVPPEPVASFVRDAAAVGRVEVEPIPARGDAVAECVSLARGGLLVLPTRHGNPIREWLLGSPAERLIRLVRAPVLVVKQRARASYRRVFVAMDLHAPDVLVQQAAALSRGQGIAVFHALAPSEELVLREMDAPPETIRAHRRTRAARAVARMRMLLADAARSAASPLDPLVAFGNAADAILAGETGHRAELIVIGKRRRGLLADFLLGSVTRQVLARSEADVLVVPVPHENFPAVPDGAASASLQG